MRHGKKFNHLGRTASHRKAMLSNMASSLIVNKRINTTLAKAKALRKFVEPLITKAKEDSTHSRRTVFSYLQDKDSVKALFGEVVDKVGNRPGGYTRIIKTGFRLGDNAEMCMMELVDFNELLGGKEETEAKPKTRRSRRGKKKSSAENDEVVEASAEVVEEVSEEVAEVEEKEEDIPSSNEDETPEASADDSENSEDEDKPEG